jgi:hypothetical protein
VVTTNPCVSFISPVNIWKCHGNECAPMQSSKITKK